MASQRITVIYAPCEQKHNLTYWCCLHAYNFLRKWDVVCFFVDYFFLIVNHPQENAERYCEEKKLMGSFYYPLRDGQGQ